MSVVRMDNVSIVVHDLDAAIAFYRELGLELQGRAPVEGEWAGRVTGLPGMRVEIAMLRTPDGHGRLELSRFLEPPIAADHRLAPVNALGYLRVMFAVTDVDDTVKRLAKHGATLVGEIVEYRDLYRLCYVRGPEGVLLGLAQELRTGAAAVTAAEREIRERHVAWLAAVNAGDLPPLLAMLADDAVLMNPGGPALDRTGFAANFRDALARIRFRCASDPVEVMVSGDLAFVRSRDSLVTAPLEGGAEAHYAGDRLTIWRRHPDGRWLLARDAHTLTPAAPEAS